MAAFLRTGGGDRGIGAFVVIGVLFPVVFGAAGGFALQRAISDDGQPAAAELPANRFAAPVHDCPDDPRVADVHNGDRVFAIAVHDELDGWLLIRNPIDPTVRWWIESRHVSTDEAIDGLPQVGCGEPIPEREMDEVTSASDETSTTTEPEANAEPEEDEEEEEDDESSTTSVAGQVTGTSGPASTTSSPDDRTTTTQVTTTTTRPRTRPTTTTTTTRPTTTTTRPTTTTTTSPPDTTGPSLSISRSPADIWEQFEGLCTGKAKSATLSATASDPSGVASVQATWSVGNHHESKSLTGGSASFGPYAYGTVAGGEQVSVQVTVTAVDGNGNSTVKSTSVTVHSADQCFG